jgi:hypothetical protein
LLGLVANGAVVLVMLFGVEGFGWAGGGVAEGGHGAGCGVVVDGDCVVGKGHLRDVGQGFDCSVAADSGGGFERVTGKRALGSS